MRKACIGCKKKSMMAGRRKLLRGHYNPTGKVRKYPNLQWARLASSGERVLMCTNCRKALLRRQ